MEPTKERIGLLFVHGMGEQKPWDHLSSSVLELAELLRQSGGAPIVSVVDRTQAWDLPYGGPHPDRLAPVELVYTFTDRSGPDAPPIRRQITYECFETYWADLGTRTGVKETIGFWLWGLGQWSAPVYRELDAAGVPPGSGVAEMPESVAGKLRAEPRARLHLLMAAVAAVFLVCTWSLAKRIVGAVIGKVPLPALLVSYIGDVRAYEARAAPGETNLSDPGHPRRVGARRRMVTQMVAMGAREDLDGWYVLAHSLGTIVAYNGLAETGQALPNYLPREQWERLPPALKRDEGIRTRQDIHAMMPARPPWLGPEDVINRPLLFSNLRGFLTYGSPLDKFAGLWPRIVATAVDRKDGQPTFARCAWVNLAAPTDPVAGCLDGFPASEKQDRFYGAIPPVRNFRAPWSWRFGLSHLLYFEGFERHRARDTGSVQKLAVADWIAGRELKLQDVDPGGFRRALAFVVYVVIILALWLAAAGLATLVFTAADFVLADKLTIDFGWGSFRRIAGTVAGAALALILMIGVLRWGRESAMNQLLAQADGKSDKVVAGLRRQKLAAILVGVPLSLLVLAALAVDLGLAQDVRPGLTGPIAHAAGWWTLIVAGIGTGIAAWTQALINHRDSRIGATDL